MMDTPPRRSNSMGAIRKPARDDMRPTSTVQTNPRQYHSSTNISAQAGPFNVSYRNDSNKLADGNRYNNNNIPPPQIESREHIRNNPLPPPPRSVSLQHPSRRRAVSALYPNLQKYQPPPPPTRSKHFGVIQCFQHPKMAQNALLSKLFPVNPVFRELVLSDDPIQGVLTLHPRQSGSTMQDQFEIGKANGPFQGVYDDSVSEKSLAGIMKLEGLVVGRVDGMAVLTLTGTIVSVPKTTNRVRFRSKSGGEGRIGKWSIWFDDYKSLERWEQVIQGQRF
ncbi:hypothetical protein BDR26DRAFT_20474 [Obelidium mucronatum]|nr:hypothetical protein BDR26DRAFT_20474 [Obelidium mucronatum]